MALTLNGVKNSLPASQLPSGYTRPTVVEFQDAEWVGTKVITIAKSVVENATASTTMTNIVSQLVTDVTTELGDYDATNTVTAWADFFKLENNYEDRTGASDVLTTTVCSFTCEVRIYVKSV
jgi:hypothetical protein